MREAATHTVLGQELLAEGVLLTSYVERKRRTAQTALFASLLGRVPILERLLFARYFALMLRAGLDVKQALGTLAKQTRNKSMQTALDSVHQGVERGQSLADSMKPWPQAFPTLFVGFISVGEATGRLQESLEVLAVQLQKEYELRRAVRGGLLYPIVILVALIAVGFAMLVFVVPRLADVFEGFNVDLPLATRVLIGFGAFFENFWYLVLLAMAVGGFGVWALLRVKAVKARVLHTFLFMPIIKPIMQNVNLARFTRNLSSLLASGVSYIEALDMLGENTPHSSYAAVFAGAKGHVKQGKLLSDFLENYPRLFPILVVNVIRVGEETGALDEVLKEIASFYESEVDQTMKNLTSIMEPVLMVGIGLAVGALAISVISPIYNLVNVI